MKKRCITCSKHMLLTHNNVCHGLVCMEFGSLTETKDMDAEVETEDESSFDYCDAYDEDSAKQT